MGAECVLCWQNDSSSCRAIRRSIDGLRQIPQPRLPFYKMVVIAQSGFTELLNGRLRASM